MKAPPIAGNESERRAAPERYAHLGALPETEFDDFTRLASHICGTPIAAISLLDGGRHWFKSKIGLDAVKTAHAISFCGHTVQGQGLFEVPDALADKRFFDNPLVTGDPHIRFYAGVPLRTPDGHGLGTLCVIDRTPRRLTPEQREALAMLSRQVMRLLELRLTVWERERAALERDRFFDLEAAQQTNAPGTLLLVEPASSEHVVSGNSDAGYPENDVSANVTPADEAGRLVALARYEILDTPPEADFDAFTWLAAHICSAPVAVISLVDHKRLWFKSKLGIDFSEMSRADSFCSLSIQGRGLFEVTDALADERFRNHPMVSGPLQVRYYAAMPLASSDGHILGNLCIMDQVPRRLASEQREALAKLAQQLMGQLELRALMRERERTRVVHERITTARRDAEQSLEESKERFKLELGEAHELLVQANQHLVQRVLEADLANRAKTTFLATMSHELRTPLNGMTGMLELLSLTPLDSQQQRTLAAARESGQALLRVIDDILQFSSIEAGDVAITPEPVSIRQVVESAVRMFAGKAHDKGIALTHTVDARVSPALMTDAPRVRQILGNFVENALKFTDAGAVAISVEWIARTGDVERIRLAVQDTGVGIDAQEQQRLLQPLGHTEGPGRVSGTGLGLTICRRLAELLGGSIDVASVPGAGTTMSLALSLPVASPPQAVRPGGEGARAPPSAVKTARTAPSVEQAEREGTLVLLADDHPMNRMLLVRQVAMLGYAAESVEDGAAALEKWKSGRFGLLITDCDMPRMDGFELTRAIRQIESANGSERTPIIACTASAFANEAHACLAVGMDDFLAKPTQLPTVLEKLNRWLPIPATDLAETATPSTSAAVTTAPVLACPPIDLELVATLSENGTAGIRDVLQLVRRTNEEDGALLRQAVAAADGAQVIRLAHRLQGAAAMAGARPLSAICKRIGAECRAGDWTKVTAEMVAFEIELLRLDAFMESVP